MACRLRATDYFRAAKVRNRRLMTLPFSDSKAPPFDAGLLRIYRASEYVCQSFRLRPGVSNGRWAESLATHGHESFTFITAYNPYSDVTTTLPENLARAQVLRKWVEQQGFDHLPAAGVDPYGVWPEEIGLMIFDMPLSIGLELGRGLGQNAILYGHGGTAEVLWCDCQFS